MKPLTKSEIQEFARSAQQPMEGFNRLNDVGKAYAYGQAVNHLTGHIDYLESALLKIVELHRMEGVEKCDCERCSIAFAALDGSYQTASAYHVGIVQHNSEDLSGCAEGDILLVLKNTPENMAAARSLFAR